MKKHLKELMSYILILSSGLAITKDFNIPVYKNMGIIQDKSFNKRGRFLLNSHLNLEFSQNPHQIYSLNFNPGFAFSDFFEVYVNLVPVYFTTERSSVDFIKQFLFKPGHPNQGNSAEIKFTKPTWQAGLDILWNFGYGKEIIFNNRKIRKSDTFLKISGAYIRYDNEVDPELNAGWKAQLGIGKTYFIGKSYGFRTTASYNLIKSVFEDETAIREVFSLEFGGLIYF